MIQNFNHTRKKNSNLTLRKEVSFYFVLFIQILIMLYKNKSNYLTEFIFLKNYFNNLFTFKGYLLSGRKKNYFLLILIQTIVCNGYRNQSIWNTWFRIWMRLFLKDSFNQKYIKSKYIQKKNWLFVKENFTQFFRLFLKNSFLRTQTITFDAFLLKSSKNAFIFEKTKFPIDWYILFIQLFAGEF